MKQAAYEQPDWVCSQCGEKYGRRKTGFMATWHKGTCGVCRQTKTVTEPRDFGFLVNGWKNIMEKEE